ncbi:hypothetical protein [Sulfurimonas sp.]|nr:hypothetical protein [Sulfurimonas sp.]
MIFSLNKILENNYKVFAKYALSESSAEEEHLECKKRFKSDTNVG